ncbi:MAG: hypothetical protein IT269_12210 [Saprospiraceae bacterium]|nr:hypothetical protein [Saprospiraceae bacterium]
MPLRETSQRLGDLKTCEIVIFNYAVLPYLGYVQELGLRRTHAMCPTPFAEIDYFKIGSKKYLCQPWKQQTCRDGGVRA